ncbi:MAG: hypothetical protein K6F53_03460, partial [Lachnospiraceae bacterium]|nr:hypothetical protein [Lachnospiraceae bacterium]
MISESEALRIKIELLSYGITFPIDLFENYEGEFYDNQFVYGQTSKDACPKYRFPQVIILRPGVNCAILRKPNSPYTLKFEKDVFVLYKNNTIITNIILPEKPKYFGTLLSDGTPIENVLAVAGEATPGFFFYPNCYYFDNGDQCKFCSMRGTRLTVGKHMATSFLPKWIKEKSDRGFPVKDFLDQGAVVMSHSDYPVSPTFSAPWTICLGAIGYQ